MSEWIKWNGGDCPVPDGTLIDVEYRDGHIEKSIAANGDNIGVKRGAFYWGNTGDKGNIVAYRLAGQQAPQTNRKPHKWAEVIKAAADGAQIEARPDCPPDGVWRGISIAMMFGMLGDGGWEFRIKPTPPPLRVEDIPLGFPCKLLDGTEFTPQVYATPQDSFFGHDQNSWSVSYRLHEIDPTSIIPTREVWLVITHNVGTCDNGSVAWAFVSKEEAEMQAIKSRGFVYGPIRIPLKPLT